MPSFTSKPFPKEPHAFTRTSQNLIEGVTPCEHVEVEGDGHHFFAVIVSSSFEGKARLARHRLIKDGLKPQLESNELHALSISVAATPAEWAAKQA